MTREEMLKLLGDNMYLAAQYLKDDASRLHAAMEEYYHFVVYEYPKMGGE